VQCTKISPQVRMSRLKVKVTGDKKSKKCGILFGSHPLGCGLRAAFFASGPRGALHACQFYASVKISTCCLVTTSIAVCSFVNTVTSERLNVGWWNLVAMCIVQESCRSLNVMVKDQCHWEQNKELIGRWDSERELFLRRHRACRGHRLCPLNRLPNFY